MKPICKPLVNTQLDGLNSLQRITEAFRYTILSTEHWLSPEGQIREWLRRNLLLCAWLLIPAICVMPAVGLVLWQLTGWLSMLTSIAAKLIMLPILILVAFVVIKIVVAFFKR